MDTHLSVNIGDPKAFLVAFEAKIRDLTIPPSKIENTRETLNKAMDVLKNPPAERYRLDQVVPGYSQAEDLAYDAMFKVQRGNAQLTEVGHKLFLALLQNLVMPPKTRKKVEIASRFYLKVTKMRLKTHGASRYMEMLDGYEKYMALVQQHAETARVAIREGKEHAEGETKIKVGSFTLVNTGGFSDKIMNEIADVVQKAQAYAKSSDVGKVCYGEVQVTGTVMKSNVAAFYLIASDELFIRANVKADRDVVKTVLHELGHRYEHKFMAGKQRDIEHLYHLLSGQERTRKYDREDLPKPGDEITEKGKTYKVVMVLPDQRMGYKVHLTQPNDPRFRATIGIEGYKAIQGIKPRNLEEEPNYKGFVTDYAKKGGPTENFAEMFAYYCLGQLPVLQSVPFEDLLFGRGKTAARRVMAAWLRQTGLIPTVPRRTSNMTNASATPGLNATPGLDAVAKKDLSAKLKQAVNKASKATDKAEDAVAEGRKGKWTPNVNERVETQQRAAVRDAVEAAYDMLDVLRPANSSRELAAIKGINLVVVKQAEMLIEGLQRLDKEHYGPLAQGIKDLSPGEIAAKLHALWSQMDLVENIYKQFRSAFWE
jgi:hypothetical protein